MKEKNDHLTDRDEVENQLNDLLHQEIDNLTEKTMVSFLLKIVDGSTNFGTEIVTLAKNLLIGLGERGDVEN